MVSGMLFLSAYITTFIMVNGEETVSDFQNISGNAGRRVQDYSCDSMCTITDSSRTLTITNNCGSLVSVKADAGNFGSCQWSGGKVPPCLSDLAPGAQAEVQLLDYHPGWGFGWQIGNFGHSTRFELTTGADRYAWDVSYNAGFDIGMTVVAPEGDDVVCTDDDAPAAYQRGADGCQVQPCLSPTFVTTSGRYELFLCNRPGDINTPGPCGCDACPGIACNQGEPACSTSGGGIWCLTGGPNCPITSSPPGTTCPGNAVTTTIAVLADTCEEGGTMWNRMADGHTCGSRIQWSSVNLHGGDINAARVRVATEYPNICGACASDAVTTTTAVLADTCEEGGTVWNRMADGHTCGSRIQWSSANLHGGDMNAARVQVAIEYPSICGACDNSANGVRRLAVAKSESMVVV